MCYKSFPFFVIPYSMQNISKKDISEVIKVLKSNYITQGPIVKDLENSISKYTNSKYAVSLYELLKSYSNHIMRKNFLSLNISKLPCCTTEQAIDIIK